MNCPSCGASLEIKYRHSRTIVCAYCGQTSYVNIDHLTAAGSPVILADYGSVLAVGKRGSIKTKDFEVLGRLRFDYEDGFWDEAGAARRRDGNRNVAARRRGRVHALSPGDAGQSATL
ncbi:MAG: DUF4178 domain-containing protein [Cytophagales bacterium]|nr:DUF4178 domain-containing protein [Cytophagales bacterium]